MTRPPTHESTSRSTYERLAPLDESFFWIEQPNAPMHVASILIFQAGNLRRSDGGIDADAIRTQIASKLHWVPRYRQKIAWIPVVRRPVWIDDRAFDIDHHVRHTSVPRPGNDEQLKRLCAQIMAEPLDRDRPLWQLHIVEGLERDRFALIAKVHHSMVDGVSGIDLLQALLSPQPEDRSASSPRFSPRRPPRPFELCRDEIYRRITRPLKALRSLGSLVVRAAEAPEHVMARIHALGSLLRDALRRPSSAPFNKSICGQRRIEWLTMMLEPIEDVRRSLGGTLNDVALTIVTGAVRRYLAQRAIPLGSFDFRVMTPVSVRTEEQSGTLGNHVSAWLIDLPVGEPDPREQLRRIHRATRDLKIAKQPSGATVLTEMSDWTYSALLVSVTARHLAQLLPCNLVLTNIPGPPVPIYLIDAVMFEAFPLVPLIDGLGLNIGIISYDGKLCWGFNADYDLVPDLDTFVRATEEAFREVCELASPAARISPGESAAASMPSRGSRRIR